jgi:ATP-dependent DNA helicase RecQ
MKKEVLSLRSGDTLFFRNDVFYNSKTDKPVAKISNKMKKTLSEWENKGYTVASASVRFVVAWKSKEAPKEDSELAVLLPDIHLSL